MYTSFTYASYDVLSYYFISKKHILYYTSLINVCVKLVYTESVYKLNLLY